MAKTYATMTDIDNTRMAMLQNDFYLVYYTYVPTHNQIYCDVAGTNI